MKLTAPGVAALSLAVSLSGLSQTATFTDPANLRGERVQPTTGRELPIDGPEAEGGHGLQQLLRKLNTRASLMLIVAHPDDEDGGMLTYYSRGRGARVATLTLTRGEGGQNAMTGDFEDALGLIRTQELLAADRYFGADQMFGTEVDFGFSKTKEEAFRKWTHERVLYDAVRAVRLYRPLVLAAVFVGGVTDGHGQHQVSGEIAQEVFKAAADPSVFPELTREGILPWAPLKVYARIPSFAITDQGLFDYATNQYVPPTFTNYVTGQTSSTPPMPDVILHEGQTDPLLTNAAANAQDLPDPNADPTARLSYVQFARIGLGLQRTQIGPNVRLATAGAYDVAYHLYGSRLCAATQASQPPPTQIVTACVPATTGNAAAPQNADFFDGIDVSLHGIAGLTSAPPASLLEGLDRLQAAMTQVSRQLPTSSPAAVAPLLVDAQNQLGGLLDSLEKEDFPGRADVLHELRIKQVQLNQAIICALGVTMEATAQTPAADVVQGTDVQVSTRLAAQTAEPVGLFSEAIEAAPEVRSERLLAVDTEPTIQAAQPFLTVLDAGPTLTGTVTRPYFQREDVERPVYDLNNPALRNAPATPPALVAWTTLRYHQTEVRLGRVVSWSSQPVSVIPPASVLLLARAQVLAPSQTSLRIKLQTKPADTRVEADLPPSWNVIPDNRPADATPVRDIRLEPPARERSAFTLHTYAIAPGDKDVTEGFRPVGYPAIPYTNFFTPATSHIVPIDLTLPKHRRIGYVSGTGDAVADNLRSVGFEVTGLNVSDLTPDRLAHFDTVILGVRTYNAHPDLHGAPTRALLDFARNGGNVIVQYQTAEFTADDAPYPLTLGNAEKVVDETAPVQLLLPPGLDPAHLTPAEQPWQALLRPNRIRSADFNGWIEERGHGFLHTWDPHYSALTETHDPGAPAEHIAPQLPQEGGLITTQLGRGHWTYVAFALYRQLPEAVPGSFRLFTNLIGLADAQEAR